MGCFITGNEVLMSAFYRAGVDIVYTYDNVSRSCINDILEKRLYAGMKLKRIDNQYAAVFLAADSALSGSRTVCITAPETLICAAAVRSAGELTGSCVFLMICETIPFGFIRAVAGMKLALWIVEDILNIENVIRDAGDFSDMQREPCIVLMQTRLLSEHAFYDERITRRRAGLVSEPGRRNMYPYRRTESEYNHMLGSGQYGVITIGEAGGYVEEIAGEHSDLRLMRVDNPSPWPEKKMKAFLMKVKKLLIVEPDGYISDTVKTMTAEGTMLLNSREIKTLLISDNNCEKKVYAALSDFLKTDSGCLKSAGCPEEIPTVKKPEVPELGRLMCPGCAMREQIVRYVMAAGGDVRLTEELYCGYARIRISTGITVHGRNHLIAATQPEKLVNTGIPTVKVKNKCRYAGGGYKNTVGSENELCGKKDPFKVFERTCNICRECIELTGCPALWDNGITAKIDPAMCVGCGLCAEVCKKGAIIS